MYQEIIMKNFKVVADSSADLFEFGEVPFASAPLKIITAKKEYVDNKDLNIKAMVDDLAHYSGRSSTSCPNTEDWLATFGEAQYIFCITITATLSGSYNAALIAKEIYEEKHPERKVYVLNSLSTGPEMALIIEKITELISNGDDFDTVCQKINEYAKQTALIFMLESMKNLANNGRVSHLTAKAAGLIGIRVVGKASDVGDLQPLNKCRGEGKALATIAKRMSELGFTGGKVRIAHCFNETAAEKLKALLCEQYSMADIEIYSCGGLCSFYAEKGGLLIGFEKNI